MRKILSIVILALLIFNTAGCSSGLPGVEIPEPSVVYDINGREIKGLTAQNRINLNINEIPTYFTSAIIAVEDKKFYSHHGVDPVGILRALYFNIREKKIVAGGSTITQQTAKNLFLTNERTLTRKALELYYALQLERKYSKDEILTMYCNTIYFGRGAYGVEMAARNYFGKHASELSLAQAALLAGLTQWPSHYDPFINPDAARGRQIIVLQRMLEENMINQEELEIALNEPLEYKKAPYLAGDAPYFIAMVIEYLTEKYGQRSVFQGGMRIYTTLDLDLQQVANQAYVEQSREWPEDLQAALIALDPDNGQIRALIGGRDFQKSAYNRVYSKRQPGSTFKPFMYSLALASGYTSADKIKCEEVEFRLVDGSVYKPKDYGNTPYHWRDFTLKEALALSDNVVAVRLNDQLGPAQTAHYAEQFGFKNIEPVLSLPLGSNAVSPLDMAAAYSVFANQGIYSEPGYILRVENQKGETLEEKKSRQWQVINEDNAYIITDMLKGVMEAGGTGAHLQQWINAPVAGKTGTTDEFKDAWMVGYSRGICCAVWVGYDRQGQVNLPGGTIAGPIWAKFIGGSISKTGTGDFIQPANIERVTVCLDSGQIAGEACPRTSTMAFIKGTEPQEICYEHVPDMQWVLIPENNTNEHLEMNEE